MKHNKTTLTLPTISKTKTLKKNAKARAFIMPDNMNTFGFIVLDTPKRTLVLVS